MKNPTHVSAADQPVQTGDRGGDEYNSLICTGWAVSYCSSPGMPYIKAFV